VERSAETTSDDPETVRTSRGTDGSNPVPSSEESAANQHLSVPASIQISLSWSIR
jgi:hypothetical protein